MDMLLCCKDRFIYKERLEIGFRKARQKRINTV